MTQRVWLVLTKVRVVHEENPFNLTIGSEALVQCFIPEVMIEVALAATDRLLESEGMRRMDVLTCTSFDRPDDEDEADAPDFVKKDVLFVRKSGRPMTGTFFTSKDTSSFQADVEFHDDPDKKPLKRRKQ
jgi:hypothetical protein